MTKYPKTRYSDEELDVFSQIIDEKLKKARLDLQLLTDAYSTGNPNDTADTSPTFKVLEEGYQVFSKEENAKFALRQEKFIKVLENAQVRIVNKTYGICRATGKLIPKERLRAVPHATLCIEEKLAQNAEKGKVRPKQTKPKISIEEDEDGISATFVAFPPALF